MANPELFDMPRKIGDENYHDYTEDFSDAGGVHTNNSIISHACYLMWKNGIYNKQRLADLWYHALLIGYDGTSSFQSVRINVLRSAGNIGMTAQEIQIVKDAFNEVGIVAQTKADLRGISILTGKIVRVDTDMNCINNVPIPNATITLERMGSSGDGTNYYDNNRVAYTDKDGRYNIINIIPGTYQLTVSCSGYYTVTQKVVFSTNNVNNYMDNIELIPRSNFGVSKTGGRIYDITNSEGVEGLTLLIREGINTKSGTVVASVLTQEDGEYMTPELEVGHYCIEIIDNRVLDEKQSRYLSNYFNIKVLEGVTLSYHDAGVCLPDNDIALKVVLEWRNASFEPHITGMSSQGYQFDVYASNIAYSKNGKTLVHYYMGGKVNWYRRIFTIYKYDNTDDGKYTFYVREVSSSPMLIEAQASVKIYEEGSNQASYVFNIPNDINERYWTVFTYDPKTGKILPVNVVSSKIEEGE